MAMTTRQTAAPTNGPLASAPRSAGAGQRRSTSPVRPRSTRSPSSPESAAACAGKPGKSRFRTIDDRADPTFNQLLGINDGGRIVGYFGSGADLAHPNQGYFLERPYQQGDFTSENVAGSVATQVTGINGQGTTVGFFVDRAGANLGFVAHGGKVTAVVNPMTPQVRPFNQLLGINDRGVAVGFYQDAQGVSHGYTVDTRRKTFTPVELPVPADSVTATGIEAGGAVSGFYTRGAVTRGFLLDHGRLRSLSFGAGQNTQALGVSDNHRVVGSYVDHSGMTHGFLWSRTKFTRIDDPQGEGGTVVNGLNGHGQLVGFFVDRSGKTHGFLFC